MGTHPIFESDFDCLTEIEKDKKKKRIQEIWPRANMSDVSGTHQPTMEQLHKMRYYIQSSSTRSSESSQSEFDENKNNSQSSQSRQDQSMMLRNMAVISQNINKKNEKKRKDKRSKNANRVSNEADDRKLEEQTSIYSACILSANCLSNATQMLQELTGIETDQALEPPKPNSRMTKNEMSDLMSTLFKLDRTLNVLNQELKKSRNAEND